MVYPVPRVCLDNQRLLHHLSSETLPQPLHLQVSSEHRRQLLAVACLALNSPPRQNQPSALERQLQLLLHQAAFSDKHLRQQVLLHSVLVQQLPPLLKVEDYLGSLLEGADCLVKRVQRQPVEHCLDKVRLQQRVDFLVRQVLHSSLWVEVGCLVDSVLRNLCLAREFLFVPLLYGAKLIDESLWSNSPAPAAAQPQASGFGQPAIAQPASTISKQSKLKDLPDAARTVIEQIEYVQRV